MGLIRCDSDNMSSTDAAFNEPKDVIFKICILLYLPARLLTQNFKYSFVKNKDSANLLESDGASFKQQGYLLDTSEEFQSAIPQHSQLVTPPRK